VRNSRLSFFDLLSATSPINNIHIIIVDVNITTTTPCKKSLHEMSLSGMPFALLRLKSKVFCDGYLCWLVWSIPTVTARFIRAGTSRAVTPGVGYGCSRLGRGGLGGFPPPGGGASVFVLPERSERSLFIFLFSVSLMILFVANFCNCGEANHFHC